MSKKKNISFEIIERYINGCTSDFSELYMLGTNTIILKYLKEYLKENPDRSYEINLLIDNLDVLRYENYQRDNLIKVLEKRNDEKTCKYIDLLINLFTKDEDAALKYLDNNKINIKRLKGSIGKFNSVYKKQKDEYIYLSNIMNKYQALLDSKSNKKKDYINVSLCYNKEWKNNINNRFESLYLSKLSIEEFCSLTGESIVKTKSTVESNLKCADYSEMSKEILSRTPSEKFYDRIISLAYEIDTNDSFDALDYYEVTRLKNSDFRDIVSKKIDKKNIVRIVQKLNMKVKLNMNLNKTIELNSKKIISGREITFEEKEAIFKYLEDNNLPLGLYNVALKRYLNDRLKVLKK